MKKMFIKTGDTVEVISGDDKGKQGIVLRVYPKTSMVIVQGINIITVHKKKANGSDKGSIVKVESPIKICKVMLVDPKNKCRTRVGRLRNEQGKLQRYGIKTGNLI